MKGTLSLDFIVAMIVVLLLASTVITFAYFQQENIINTEFKVDAEMLATDAGSAINRVVAYTGPNDNVTLTLTPHDITSARGFFGILITDASCSYSVSPYWFNVTVTYTTIGTNRNEVIKGSYPLFLHTVLSSGGTSGSCGSSFTLKKTKEGWSIG